MASGIVTKVVGDGNGGTISHRYWCPDTSASPQLLFPAPLLVDTSGNPFDLSAGTAGTPAGGVSSIQGVSGMTPVDANVKQINGVTVLMGNGVTGTGSQRVTVASDNTPFAVKTDQTTHGTTDLVAADITKIGGTAVATSNGVVSAGVQRVAVASDNTPFAVKIDQTTPGTTNAVALTSGAFDVATTITRPANTTAYTANDVLGGALDLGVLGPSGAAIQINSLQLEADIAAVPAGQTTWILHLYNVTPPSATADNGAFDLPSGDRASYLGQIAIATMVGQGSTLYVEANNIGKQVKLSGTHLFGYLVTVGGFTPAANSEVYKLTVHTVAL